MSESDVRQRLRLAVERIERYADREQAFVEGGPDDVIETPNGSYPSLARLAALGGEAASLLEQANTVLGEAQQLRNDASDSATAAGEAESAADQHRADAAATADQLSAALATIEHHHGRPLLLAGEAY